jgi:protein TonB
MRYITLVIIGLALIAGPVGAEEPERVCKEPAVIFDESAGMTEPEVTHKVNPAFPREALKEKASGLVVLDVVIDSNGAVGEITVVESPNEYLSKAAVDAMRQWKYEPARNKDGEAIAVCYLVKIGFHLK